ncbi:rRNA N6-adenosine-methyltransferase METTL5 [Phymastichus coffea]|uniref:rRNA N6-adenosine-methyltransferase METTL5 n=1 Tax=Phymastichus coffea TaxID=108790 RepID=UPI00273C3A80|nr:rRNA N6-adenosine-methyltransferase METTL5 [Phymastichus coffea]
MIKIRELEEKLQYLLSFEVPNISLEQYSTSSHIASRILYVAQTQYADITNQYVADLGTGCGILSVGSSILGAASVIGFDIDMHALQIRADNYASLGLFSEAVCCDVLRLSPGTFDRFFDTVIMNPPFGTKHNAGSDMKFLEIASKLSQGVIYSLHKTSTRRHIIRKSAQLGMECDVLAELKFDIPLIYKFHKKKSTNVAVDFIRFCHK